MWTWPRKHRSRARLWRLLLVDLWITMKYNPEVVHSLTVFTFLHHLVLISRPYFYDHKPPFSHPNWELSAGWRFMMNTTILGLLWLWKAFWRIRKAWNRIPDNLLIGQLDSLDNATVETTQWGLSAHPSDNCVTSSESVAILFTRLIYCLCTF